METQTETLKEYLRSQEWENVGVIAIGDELYATVHADNFTSVKLAAYALAGTLTAYGDYKITDRTAMRNPSGEIVSVTYTVQQN